jgi:hypothetical protein
MLLEEWELWACAQQVLMDHGSRAPLHAASRIGELADVGDMAGVETWQAIACRVDQLMDYRAGAPLKLQ